MAIESIKQGGAGREGIVIVSDLETGSVVFKNWIVVGNSCGNKVAASLLGSSSPICGEAFTQKTGIGPGEFLIETFSRPGGAIATLVAGYNGDDTIAAAKYLITQNIDTTIGKKYTGTSAMAFETNTMRGDVNGDGLIDISDVIYLLRFLFQGGQKPPSIPMCI